MSSSPTNKSAATAVAACIKEDATSANAHRSKLEEESPSVPQSNSSESADPPINVKSQIKALGYRETRLYRRLLKVGLLKPVSSFTDNLRDQTYILLNCKINS